MRAPLELRPRAGVEAQAERPHARPHSEKKNMVLYLCFWTLGLLLVLRLLLTSLIQTRRIAALTSGELARLARLRRTTGFESCGCTGAASVLCWRRTCSAMLPGLGSRRSGAHAIRQGPAALA